MTRVLHIFNELMPSGAETMWHAAADILNAYDVETVALSTAENVGPYAATLSNTNGFSVAHVPYRMRTGYWRRLWQYVRAARYDAAIVHTEQRLFTNALVCRLAGLRVVCVHHAIFRWRGKSRLKRCVVVFVLKWLGCRFVGVSSSVVDNEHRFFHRPKMILNWIDEARFIKKPKTRERMRSELGLRTDDRVLLSVGNCAAVKNHQFLLEVLSRLPKQYVLLHVGREDESLCHEREIAARLGVRVAFLGARSDLRDIFAASDLFVMSSLSEGLGLACLEALYCGLPAVVSDVEGLREIAQHISTCHLCALDEEKFAIQIQKIDRQNRLDLKTCRELVRDFVSMERSVTTYLELLGIKDRKGVS